MTVRTSKSIWCDDPDCYVWEWVEEGKPPVRWAKGAKWTREHGLDYCPTCSAIRRDRANATKD